MSQHPASEADDLFEFISQPEASPRTELEGTARQVQRATGTMTSSIPTTHRQQIWEELMRNATIPSTKASLSDADPTISVSPPGWVRAQVTRWQPVVSFGLVLLLIVGMMAITMDRIGDGTGQPSDGPSGLAGLTSQEGTSIAADMCVARDEPWDPGVSGALNPDRPARYTAIRHAPEDIGALALETYLDYMACSSVAWRSTDSGQRDAALTTMQTYMTTDGCSAEHGDSECFLTPSDPLGAEFLLTAPITLNQPHLLHHFSGTTWSVQSFSPGDVYEFFDGRYGVVVGSPSTNAFRDRNWNAFPSGSMPIFVAFREQDGRLYIDEHAWVSLTEPEIDSDSATPAATGG